MASLWISEFPDVFSPLSPIAAVPAVVDQSAVTISGTSAQSSAFGSTTKIVRLFSDTNCHVLFGSNPTATTSKMPLEAGAAEYFRVVPGDKVAVIERV